MKVGDLVRLVGSFHGDQVVGVIIACSEFSLGWHTISCSTEAKPIHWPETQIEVLSESR